MPLGPLKNLKEVLQHFELVSWRIRCYVFLMSGTSCYILYSSDSGSRFGFAKAISLLTQLKLVFAKSAKYCYKSDILLKSKNYCMIMLVCYSEGISGHFFGLFKRYKHSWTHVHSPKEIIYLEKVNMGICIHRCNSLCIFSIEAGHNL